MTLLIVALFGLCAIRWARAAEARVSPWAWTVCVAFGLASIVCFVSHLMLE